MADDNENLSAEEVAVRRILHAVGPRDEPSPEVYQSAFRAVRGEWRATVEERQRRRRIRALTSAIAASLALAALALWITRTTGESAGTVAQIARMVGDVRVKESFLKPSHAVEEQQALKIGEKLTTGASGRVALSLFDGTSVRLDHRTSIVLTSAQSLSVLEGAVYVDSNGGTGRLTLEIPGGFVRHVGTQYEVRLVGDYVRIRVREGEIEVARQSRIAQHGRAGEQLIVSPRGQVARAPTARHGALWDWTQSAAPSFSIEGRSLHEFLTWEGRELGRDVVFASPELETRTRTVVLRGSISGLSPSEALSAVMATTPYRAILRDGQLRIELAPQAGN